MLGKVEMTQLSDTETAVAFIKYDCDKPAGNSFRQFYEMAIQQFDLLGIEPRYISVDGTGFNGKLTKFGGAAHKKLQTCDFRDVEVVSIVSNPSESDEPAYDGFAKASISYTESNRELMIYFVINAKFLQLYSPEFESLVQLASSLESWDFGYGFSARVEKQAEYYILGLDNGELSDEEYEALSAWYSSTPQTRTEKLRDVFPYNFVNEKQLSQTTKQTDSLKSFIESDEHSKLAQLNDGLMIWKVAPEHMSSTRRVLVEENLIIQ